MSETASISSGIAARYAKAIFDLAKEAKTLPALEKDLNALAETLETNAEFRDLVSSPLYSRDEQGKAVLAIAAKLGVSTVVSNTLGLMANKRRLFVLPWLISSVDAMIAEEKGEVTAEITAAKALTKTQTEKLAKTLKASVGKEVIINLTVDENLIGGLIVRVGSQMIDTSISSQLSNLQNSMKEVG